MKKIRLWWKFEIKYFHKDLIQGIKNLIKYFKIIWKDRNYDYKYIYDLLQFKLNQQSKYIGFYNRHTTAKRDAWVMSLIVKLIEKVKNEDYGMEYMDYHKSEHYFIPILNQPGYSEWKTKEISNNFDDYFKKYPLIYKYVLKLGEKNIFPIKYKEDKHQIAMNISQINQSRAKKLLFKLLEENISHFWD